MRRAFLMLLPATLGLPGCGSREVVEDPSPPVRATVAVPSAAPGALGAQFNAPVSARPGRGGPSMGPQHPFEPPDNPYGEPQPAPDDKTQPPDAPDTELDKPDAGGGPPAARPPKPKGVSL